MIKLATEVTFTINKYFYKQTDRCAMCRPLSVTLSDIYMNKMENDVVVSAKPVFHCRFVDDIYNRRKNNTEDKLYHSLSNYHKNIKLTIEVRPTKFLDTHLFNQTGTYITQVHRKKPKQQHNGHYASPKDIRETA